VIESEKKDGGPTPSFIEKMINQKQQHWGVLLHINFNQH
jgi:hypothetical protein